MTKYFTRGLCLAIPFLLLAGCKTKQKPVNTTAFDGFTQGTTYHIVVKGSEIPDLKPGFDSLFAEIGNSLSLFDENSLLSRINRNETDRIDRHIGTCIEEARKTSTESGGIYDITIKPVTAAYGFAGDNAAAKPVIDSLMQFVGYQKIGLEGDRLIKENPGVQIDLNSIAQGYTVDYAAAWLESLGYTEYLVEMGGEVFCKGLNGENKPWKVGIDKPAEGNNIPGRDLQVIIELSGRGLATSGNYRKFHTDASGRKIVHTINALTGEPVISNLLSATVVANDATLADAYGTMLMLIGLEKSKEFLSTRTDLDAYLIYVDQDNRFRAYSTPNLSISDNPEI
ncbi:MAG: FAD:protein FMN transferase [Rikenellaceae bacterium]|jgi:thiamine biosynthesis lipoprotein|nr:FAD:protein FMN transferase [Rikenellaceae bacterium]